MVWFSVMLLSVFTVSTIRVVVIVTVSWSCEIFIATGRFRAWPKVRSSHSATAVATPCFDTVTE